MAGEACEQLVSGAPPLYQALVTREINDVQKKEDLLDALVVPSQRGAMPKG